MRINHGMGDASIWQKTGEFGRKSGNNVNTANLMLNKPYPGIEPVGTTATRQESFNIPVSERSMFTESTVFDGIIM